MTNDQPSAPTSTPAESSTHGEYEFAPPQEIVIRELAGAMQFVGTFAIGLAGLMWLIGIAAMFTGNPVGLSPLIQGVLLVFIGVWTRSSAKSFQLVVDTRGNDIANLMNALGELRRLYTLQKWVMILALVLFVLAFAGGVAWAFLMVHHRAM